MDTFCIEVGLAGRSKYLARERLRFSDNLLVGPSAKALTTHVRKRERYWNASPGERKPIGRLYEELAEGCAADRVDVVSAGKCSDLLFLGLIMHLGRARHQEVYWHRSPPFERHEEEEPIELTPHRDALRRLWLAFTGNSPKRFLERLAGFRHTFPAQALRTMYLACFPRMSKGRWFLAGVDASLLGAIKGKWRTPVEALVKGGTRSTLIRFGEFGDVVLAQRLKEWADLRASDHLVELRPNAQGGDRAMRAGHYRLTDAGEQLLREGVGSLARMPPLLVGGVNTYQLETPLAS